MTRWNGSYLGTLKNTATGDSGGIWNLKRQTLAKQFSTWPLDNSVIPIPSWTLDFSSGTPSGYTLTRSGTGATFVNSSGYIEAAGENVARLTHNSSGIRLGLLVEAERTNDFQFSEDPSNAYWTKTGSGINNNSGAFWTAPDNAATAVLLRGNTSTGVHNITRAVSTTTDAVFSVFLKKQTTSGVGRYATLILRRSSTDYYHVTFDLDQGTVTQSALVGTLLSATDHGIEAYADGWYRCWVRGTQASATQNVTIALATTATPTMTSTGESYTGANTTDGVYIWGLMREANNTPPTSYIKTPSSASVTRSADFAHILDENITSWSDPGALVIHFYQPGQAGTLISTDDATNQQLGIKANTTTTASSFWSSGETSTGTIGSIGVNKAVHYWDGTTSKFCINGGSVVSETNNITTFSNIDYITLGAEATSSTSGYSQYANCIIRKVEFYPGQLDNEKLQLITNNTYNIEYLVIAGGGGGYGAANNPGGGGGGAGGYRTATGLTLTPTNVYTVTVGAGGAGGLTSAAGSDSSFSGAGITTITSTGGGDGNNGAGGSGGSGGGGGYGGAAGTGTSGQGNNGGAGNSAYPGGGGGGGGASAVGAAGASGVGGNGGAGTASSITGTSVTRAGGGGGAVPYGSTDTPGTGGAGGGGNGGGPVTSTEGTVNTGGGGGGGAYYGGTNGGPGRSGGSGVVILRIPTINYTGTIIGNPTVTTDGGFTILTFNGSGSYTA
jgi:hypothetical protein